MKLRAFTKPLICPIARDGSFHRGAAALPLLSDKTPLERREISLVTAFGGPGGRDAFEMVTRCVTDGRLHVDKNLPEAADALESPGGRYYFRFTYRGRSVEITIRPGHVRDELDRKSTRLNSSHARISYAVFCLKKKN